MVSFKESIPDTVSKGSVSVPDRLEALNKTQLHAVLATVSGGRPHTSLIAFALTADLRTLIFATPKATAKHRNILKNSRVSLLIDTRTNSDSDYIGAEAVTITGTAMPMRKGKQWTEIRNVLTSKHPALKDFVDAPGTALVMVRISRCVHVGRFQAVSVWEA
jgi:general stress protein 26